VQDKQKSDFSKKMRFLTISMPLPMHSDSPKPSSNPCPRPHRFWTNGTYSGRTGSGPLARRVSLECECGANECLISARKCGFERFQCRCTLLVHSPKPSSNSSRCPHRLWMNGTDSGRTGILADERAEGPLARRVSVECECGTDKCLIEARKCGFERFQCRYLCILIRQNRVQTLARAHTVSGRKVRILDERAEGPLTRRVGVECECGANECLISARKCGFERFQCRCTLLVHSPKPSSNPCPRPHRLWTNGQKTASAVDEDEIAGRTGRILDKRAEGPLTRRVSVECECRTSKSLISARKCGF
jgi:hypothetical protein